MKLLIANWKMNPQTEADAIALAKATDAFGAVLCPPFPYLEAVKKVITKAKLGAQDMFWETTGAFTGEIDASQLKDLGVSYVILGHSERRQNVKETDEMVAKKMKAASEAGLTPILCIGETKEEREKGQTQEVLRRQLSSGLSLIEKGDVPIIVAYEPIWAIGSGTPLAPQEADALAQFIKQEAKRPNLRVIYGGSTNASNIQAYLSFPHIDGALPGGASLDAKEFQAMVAKL